MTVTRLPNNDPVWAQVPADVRAIVDAAVRETCGVARPRLQDGRIIVTVYLDFPGHDDVCELVHTHPTPPRAWRAVRAELLTRGFVVYRDDCVEWIGPVVEEDSRVSPRYRVVDHSGDAAVVLYETNNAWLAKYYARFYGALHLREDVRVEDRQSR